MDRKQLEIQAEDLVRRVSEGCTSQYYGSWTLSVYDSAWLAMLQKPNGSWLFPESFEYVLREQQSGSGWHGYACEIDAILNTMAALLAVERHRVDASIYSEHKTDLDERKEQGLSYLRDALSTWNVHTCMHVGFEILVPALLKMLQETGMTLDFPGKSVLMALNAQKMKHFRPEMLYSRHQATALHSLEAFIEVVDFTKVQHHLVNGSMLGSPSSTAAYLMNTTTWDSEAEQYLKDSVNYGGGEGLGGVPSAFPCENFEFTWVLTTFHTSQLPHQIFDNECVSKALDAIAAQLQNNGGTIGYSSGFLSDADDTAKAIHILNTLGRPTSCDQMISHFMSPKGHMSTYLGERNLSPSANCNALFCILDAPNLGSHVETVTKITRSLCDHWWENKMIDKWNLSNGYTAMLLAQAFTQLLRRWDSGALEALPKSLLQDHLRVVLFQLMNRLLFGSDLSNLDKQPYPESVAYDVLACTALRSLPLPKSLVERLDINIQRGQSYLMDRKPEWKANQYLWIEKVTYGAQVLSETYGLAALLALPDLREWSASTTELFQLSSKSTELSQFFHIAQGSKEDGWKYEACIYEASAFTAKLQASRSDIFPLREGVKDEYLVYIPAAWTIVNNIRQLNLSANLLWEMMWFSMLDFLVDEYMESKIDLLDITDRMAIKAWIQAALPTGPCQKLIPQKRPLSPDTDSDEMEYLTKETSSETVRTVTNVLRRYIDQVLQHPKVRTASRFDRDNVRRELHDFLIAHMLQMEDNRKLSVGSSLASLPSPRSSFYTWSRSTGSQHISALLSFAFYSCLLSGSSGVEPRRDCFQSPLLKYKASDLSARLAVMSRLFNDWSSVTRDLKEGNLNSLNFPEFCGGSGNESLDGLDVEDERVTALRDGLLQLSEYERQACRLAMANLFDELDAYKKAGHAGTNSDAIRRSIELFVYVTELFADMYVAKDLTNATKAAATIKQQ